MRSLGIALGILAMAAPSPTLAQPALSSQEKALVIANVQDAIEENFVFADETQIRLGRNSTLIVNAVGPTGPSELSLSRGSFWARAKRGAATLSVRTPA
ncbi:MAG: FecR domain-containing protein, partial [Pseudomonadota bacterium]